MRTLFEIIESAKDGNRPTLDECYYAMLALAALHTFDGMDMLHVFQKAQDGAQPFGVKFIAEESFNRNKRALNADPQAYVGWNNDPANPEYQKMRKIASDVFKKATKA